MKYLLLFLCILVCQALPAQVIHTIAGNGTGDDGIPATDSRLYNPNGFCVDKFGNFYFSQNLGHKVRKIDTHGIITTFAGTGGAGFGGDGGAATDAHLNQPLGITVDSLGNLFIADTRNNRIRRVDRLTGIITSVVGDSLPGYTGDGGLATAAKINSPTCVAFDNLGNLFVGDNINNRIRKINNAGIISTFAGNGRLGVAGDNGPAILAEITPFSMVFDKSNNLYVSEEGYGLNKIRKIDVDGIITSIAGDSTAYLYNGDGIPATNAKLDPYYIIFDDLGNLLVTDVINNRIRKIDTLGFISTIAGNGIMGYTGDGGIATLAELDRPSGIALDRCGNLYIGQVAYFPAIRKVIYDSLCDPYTSGNLEITPVFSNTISIYPIPVTNSCTIKVPTTIASISLENSTGQTLFTQNYNTTTAEIDMSSYPAGMYIVKVRDKEGGVVVKKIVKE